jgi:large subunit ribosomal protein L19
MASVTIEELRKEEARKKLPRFKSGQTVRVYQKIKEGEKERIQIFQGLILETSGGQGITKSITVRKVVDGIGVEKVFPLQSPFIEKIELVKEAKVRRSRIFFMRDRSGKSARLRERFFSAEELKEMTSHEVTEEEVQEAVQHQKEEEAKAAEEENSEKEETAEETPEENTQPSEEKSQGADTEDQKMEKGTDVEKSEEEKTEASMEKNNQEKEEK